MDAKNKCKRQIIKMTNSIIATKTEENNFGNFLFKEKIITELTLVQTDLDKFGINYQIVFTGAKDGSTNGGPMVISKNEIFQANADPLVTVTISEYEDSGATISMHILIRVALPVLGTKSIFDGILAGPYRWPSGSNPTANPNLQNP